MRSSQDQVFATFEGDKWFERNRDALECFDPEADLPLKLMELYHLRPCSVLEIGAANGFRLAAVSQRYGARVVAVEPSVKAILDGKAKYPSVEFVRGVAYAIPLRDVFDLVILNFVFHWLDRVNLLRSVAEIDRVLLDGGFLMLGDFLPSNLVRVPYHHLPGKGVYTYKQNYAATFLASGLYHPVCLMTSKHSSKALIGEVTEDERIGVWLLRKVLKELYVDASLGR
jgi:SAM-dependent methyltransferase